MNNLHFQMYMLIARILIQILISVDGEETITSRRLYKDLYKLEEKNIGG